MRRDRGLSVVVLILVAGVLRLDHPALASVGKLEINQQCVAVGCFPGDAPGFPVQLVEQGSYVLTGNLDSADAPVLQPVIQITAAFISLDLNGFTVLANSSADPGAIQINASYVEVKNGVLSGTASAGIVGNGSHLRLLDLRIVLIPGGPGIELGGYDIQIRNCLVSGNGGNGGILALGLHVAVVGCTVTNNTQAGIRIGPRSLVADNVVSNNTGHGIDAGTSSTVRGNVVTSSGAYGINLEGDTLVIGNTVVSNGLGNIATCASCTIVDNEAP